MISGNLVNLVALEKEHLEQIRIWRSSSYINSLLFQYACISKEEQERWYKNIIDDSKSKYFAIEDKNKNLLGLIYLTKIDYINRNSEWGFFIGDENKRNIGYGAEAEYLILTYAFEVLNLNKLYCYEFTFNEKVIAMHKRFNFKEEGTLRKHVYHNGKYEDVLITSILKEEFESEKVKWEMIFRGFNNVE